MDKKHYVLGFMFSPEMDRVVLIEKQKPEWQKGLLNGVVGKIETYETPEGAMIREFYEETGVVTNCSHWLNVGSLQGSDYKVAIFMASSILAFMVETNETEEVGVYGVSELNKLKTIPNLQYIIPAMLEHNFVSIDIQYV